MRILVACELPASTIKQLETLASTVVVRPVAKPQELYDDLSEVGVLIVDKLRLPAETLSRAPRLQMIVRAGPGPGDIAIEEASAEGIFVTNVPDMNAAAIAELTFGLILALDRQLVENANASREGRWIRSELGPARGLAGRTLGILGYGPVGRQVAHRALAFEMRVAAWSPTLGPGLPDERGITFCDWPRELARMCDIVTVHEVPDAEKQTRVDSEFLENLPTNAYLIHVSEPGAVDEAALATAIKARNLRVAIDIRGAEPRGESPRHRRRLADNPNVIATQNIGPLTQQALQASADEVVRIVRAFVTSGEVRNCLNLAERSPATWQLVLRVRDQVGVMAAVLDAIRADGINAEEITSRVFAGAKAACCTIALDERPSTEALDAIRELGDVLHLELRAVV